MPSSSDVPEPVTGGPAEPGADQSDQPEPNGLADGIHESNGSYESEDGIYDNDDLADSSVGSRRLSWLNMGLLCLSVVSLSAALYISPAGSDVREKVGSSLPGSTIGKAIGLPSVAKASTPTETATLGAKAWNTLRPSASTTPGAKAGTTLRPSSSATPGAKAGTTLRPSPTAWHSAVAGTGSQAGTHTGGPSANVAALSPLGTGPSHAGGTLGTGNSTPSTSAKALTKCWQFTWQQDAQVVYVRNLSDPYGLDADVGPNDGDGIACSDLPVDPGRAASKPIAAYSPPKPSVASKRALVTPEKDYFGFMQDGVPGNDAALDELARRAGKAPSATGWFASFDTPYRGDLVRKSWTHGALPVVTWMPTDEGSGTSYSLTTIINGTHDRYLRRFAGDVVREGLPVALRFGHEMNGSWYGWSAGRSDYNNTPAKYVAAWRHIWQVFDDVGATDEVIWLWSPSRVDDLRPSATNGLTPMADDYPGDAYVDWVGASVYLRHASVGTSYAASFGRTVADLKAVTDKPLFFGETAAIQTDLGTDRNAMKADWIGNVLNQFVADEQVVGFLWFNNVAATVINGVETTNDWRFDATTITRDAFRNVVDGPAFAEGVPPD